jgi:hypothetical protein
MKMNRAIEILALVITFCVVQLSTFQPHRALSLTVPSASPHTKFDIYIFVTNCIFDPINDLINNSNRVFNVDNWTTQNVITRARISIALFIFMVRLRGGHGEAEGTFLE